MIINISRKAFTLAEIMIVLTVIGILTAILMPIAIQSAPDENVMKFKKANATLGTVIRELVNSDKYYLDGDLGRKADGTLIDGTHAGDYTYFCQTLAEILTIKKLNCSSVQGATDHNEIRLDIGNWSQTGYTMTEATAGVYADTACKKHAKTMGGEIVLNDGTTIYQTSAKSTFGASWTKAMGDTGASQTTILNGCKNSYGKNDLSSCNAIRYYDDPNGQIYNSLYGAPFASRIYKIICIDIDGTPTNATSTDCINECPFGYGIRADGKIFLGARAQEWLEKSIQRGDD